MVSNIKQEDKFKEQIEEKLILNTLPTISYKFWDIKQEEMFSVSKVTYDVDGLPNGISVRSKGLEIIKWHREGTLIPSTDLEDKDNETIFAGDIVVCGFLDSVYKYRVVFWDNGWRVIGCTTDEFKSHCKTLVSKVGNIWEDHDVFKIYKEKFMDVLK